MIPNGADAYWYADDDPCPWCGEDRRLSVDPETGLCCRWDYEMAEAAVDPDPDAYDDENHVRRMAAFAEEVTCE